MLLNTALFVGVMVGILLVFRGQVQAALLFPWFTAALTFGIAFIVLGTVGRQLVQRGLGWQDLGLRPLTRRAWPLLWQIPLVLMSAIAFQGLVISLFFHAPAALSTTRSSLPISGPPSALVLNIVALTLVTPLWEEVIFRGLIYSALRKNHSSFWPIIVSAACFAACHISPVVMPYVFVLGIGAAWLTTYYRSLWASLALHVINNSLVVAAVLSQLTGGN